MQLFFLRMSKMQYVLHLLYLKKCSDYLKIFLIMLSAMKGLFPKKSTYR